MEHPAWILVPWSVFAIAAGLKAWRLFAGLRQTRRGQGFGTEQARRQLEKIWQQDTLTQG